METGAASPAAVGSPVHYSSCVGREFQRTHTKRMSAPTFDADEQALLCAFSAYLAAKPNFDATSLEIVQQTLSEAAGGIDFAAASSNAAQSIRPFALLDVFNAGRAALERQRADFEAHVAPKLVAQGFFGAHAAGSAEHDKLLAHARMKFFAKKSADAPSSASAAPAAAAPVSPVNFAKAEEVCDSRDV
jgi:hypothetical protein